MENHKFDPSKATIGVHNRVGFNPKHRPEVSGNESVHVDPEDVGRGIGTGMNADDDFSLSRYEAMKVGTYTQEPLIKEGNVSDYEGGGEYAPGEIAYPHFPQPGQDDVDESTRHSSTNTDLDTHGSHEAIKPDPKQIIKERLRNQRVQMFHNAKKEVQEHAEKQEAQYESSGPSTDLTINRKELDLDRSGSMSKKGSVSMLSLLEEEDANPIKIMLVLDQLWEEDWRDWEPETIIKTIRDDGIDVEKINLDKIMALKVLMNTMEFWEDPRVFEKVCLAFAGRMVDWGIIQQPRVHEIAACVALVERYVAEHEFSDDVATYVAGSAVRDGYVLLPPVLSFAQFPFSNELAFSMGDDVLDVQNTLMEALEDEKKKPPEEHAVQYMRLLRCQYHTQDMIDQARS